MRINYLCDPVLVDGFISNNVEIPVSPPKGKNTKKAVNFEQANNLIKNKLFSRLT